MVLLWIGIAIGVLIATILIVKAVKTPSRDVVGVQLQCNKCGSKTNGMKCPKCGDKPQTFGV
jgi:rubrerythrin